MEKDGASLVSFWGRDMLLLYSLLRYVFFTFKKREECVRDIQIQATVMPRHNPRNGLMELAIG